MSDKILKVIKERFKSTFHYKDLSKVLGIKGQERKEILLYLEELVEKGILMNAGKGKFQLPSAQNYIKATVLCHRDGFAFAIPFDGNLDDIFLPPHTLKNVYDGDVVSVKVVKRRGRKKEGEIVKVLERGIKKIVGTVYKVKDRFYVKPYDSKLYWPLLIKEKKKGITLKAGDTVVSEIIEYPVNKMGAGFVLDVIKGDDYSVEVKNLILKSGIDDTYPVNAVKDAEKIIQRRANEKGVRRKDLTNLPFVTIDGENAKDFDDAVCLVKLKSGFKLYVAIADVGHFVKTNSVLDKEAEFRGNSYYFPDRVLPMLPEILSNEECSLKPGVERFVFVVEILYDKNGGKIKSDFYLAKIKSVARLTYEAVEDFFCGRLKMPEPVSDMLNLMRTLTELLYVERHEKGTIDFDVPEPEIIIGISGKIENIAKSERLSSHRVIEEFMIAANRSVAEWFYENDLPTLYRIHEVPDREKISYLKLFLSRLGCELVDKPSPKDLQKVIQTFKNSPHERLVSTLVLRSMKQAKYSSKPVVHFGLALEHYLHFTSPIRRYADLIVHRNLRDFLVLKEQPQDIDKIQEKLDKVALHLTKRERLAFDMEKEIFNFSCVKFMKEKVGYEFDGIVSSVTNQGLYIELLNYFIEGFIPIESMDDFYMFDENYLTLTGRKRKKRYGIGKEVKVRVVRVDLVSKKVEFKLL